MRDPKFIKGVEFYNSGKYFDAHEIWEDLWNEEKGESKKFVQALIQLATSLHHFRLHNLKGAKLLYDGGMALIEPYGQSYWGLDLENFKRQMRVCYKDLLTQDESTLPGRMSPDKEKFPVQLIQEFIPEIRLKDC